MKLAVFLMLAVSACGGQILQSPFAGNAQTTTVTPVLHCAKYQHVQPQTTGCNSTSESATWCNLTIPAHCVDDMHEVTEREWQQLQQNHRDSLILLHEDVRELEALRTRVKALEERK